MAAKRKAGTKKSTGTRKKSTKKTSAKKQNKLSYNAVAFLLIFAAALFGVFVYASTDAVVAAFFHDILYGLFAKTACFIPLMLAGLGIYVIKMQSYDRLALKSVLLFCFTVSVGALIHTLSGKTIPISELYGYGLAGVGGGLFGGLLSVAFTSIVGSTASVIIFIFAAITLMSVILKISIISAISTFVSGIFGLRKEFEDIERPDKYEQGQKVKKKVKKIVPEQEKPKLTGEILDFEIDGKEKPASKKKKAAKAEEEKPAEPIAEDVIPVSDIESVIFTPEPEVPAAEPAARSEEPVPETTDENPAAPDAPAAKSAAKEEKAKPITTAERDEIHSEIDGAIAAEVKEYKFPPMRLLKAAPPVSADKRMEMRETAQKLMEVLNDFNVDAKLLQVTQGPSVTRYEIQPETGVKLSKITGLAEDIAWKLAVPTVLVAAVPGKAAVGIEVPNKSVMMVSAREILENKKFKDAESKLAVAFGKDIGGNVVVGDIAKMPHVLIAGSTGSGKSVCINTIITSILYKAKPEEVKLIMVDPKVVELGIYNGIPHLLIPVVTDPKRAAGALNWAVQEMMKRYSLFAETHVRNLEGYNKHQKDNGEQPLPKIVIIIDELADLMMVAAKEVEDAICRLAQLARAAGIHLIVATQRPSVDVITGLIKANVPSRIAFAVSSQVDSRTILDRGGAEKLLGKGDMLYYPSGLNTPLRVQGAFVSDAEIESIVDYIKQNTEVTHYSEDLADHIERCSTGENGVTDEDEADDADALLPQAIELAYHLGQISTAMVQRRLKVGYARAGRIIDQMEARGIISGANGSKPREVFGARISTDDMPE